MSFQNKHHTPAAIAKIGEANKKRVRSAASRAKTSAALRGRPVSQETRTKLRATMRKPEVRAKLTGLPARKPLTDDMAGLLRLLAEFGRVKRRHMKAKSNIARTARIRGYIAFHREESEYSLTDAGRAALERT